MRLSSLFSLIFCLYSFYSYAQFISKGIGTGSPDSSAVLDINSLTKDQGILIPRLTTAERNAINNPAQSLMIYNITDSCFQGYIGNQWVNFACKGDEGCVQAPNSPIAIEGPGVACIGDTVSYFIHSDTLATHYEWTIPTGWQIVSGQGDTLIRVIPECTATIAILCVTANNACGISVPACLYVDYQPIIKPVNITQVTTACFGEIIDISVNEVCGARGYHWTYPNGWQPVGVTDSNVISLQVHCFADSGTVCVKAYNECDTSNQTCTAVVYQPVEAPVFTGPTVVCKNDTVSYTYSNVCGAPNYAWQVPTGWQTIGNLPNGATFIAGAIDVDICLIAFNNCIDSARTCIHVSPPPLGQAAAILGPSPVCVGDSVTFYVNSILGADLYTWTSPNGFTLLSGQGDTAVQFLVDCGANNGSLTVKATNICGSTGPTTSRNISVTNSNSAGNVSGPATVCIGDTVNYTVNNNCQSGSFTWTVPSGWTILNGQGTRTLTALAGTSHGSVCVRRVTSCGTSNQSCRNLSSTIATPGSISGPNSLFCYNTIDTFSVPAVSGATSYSWTFPSGWTVISGQGTNSIVVLRGCGYGNVEVRAVNVCDTSFVRTVVAAPTISNIDSIYFDRTAVCLGDTMSFSIDSVCGATSFNWSSNSSVVLSATSGLLISGIPNSANSNIICASASNLCDVTQNCTPFDAYISCEGFCASLHGQNGAFRRAINDLEGGLITITNISSGASVFRIQESGVATWSKFLNSVSIRNLFQSQDSSIILLGEKSDNALVMKVDFISGNIIWSREIGGLDKDLIYDGLELSDGGLVLVGETQSFTANLSDCYIFKLDQSGSLIWTRYFGQQESDRLTSVDEIGINQYIITGEIELAGKSRLYVASIDSNGLFHWEKTYSLAGNEDLWSPELALSQNSEIFIVNKSSLSGQIVLSRLSISGVLISSFTSNLESFQANIKATQDGGFILTGYTGSGPGRQLHVVKLSSSLTISWQNVIGDSQSEIVGHDVVELNSGNFVCVGENYPHPFISLINSNGQTCCASVVGNITFNSINVTTVATNNNIYLGGSISNSSIIQSSGSQLTFLCTFP